VPYAELGLRILGIGMAISAWACVAFPGIRVGWKGGNRAPLSRRSKFIMAVGWTAWCCAVFGLYPVFFAALFAACVLFLFPQATRDRDEFDASRGIRKLPRVHTAAQYWPALCVLDAFVLSMSLYAVLRDTFYPPQNEEQHIVHIMGICYLVASGVCAAYLYFKRPKRDQE
jgi:hypothetical protein